MATETGSTEVLLPKKGEAEIASLTSAQFEKAVIETLAVELKKHEESQLNESSAEVKIGKNVDRSSDSGTLEDASFLAPLSGSAVFDQEASRPDDCQVDKLKLLQTAIPEIVKQYEHVQHVGVLDEIVYEVDHHGKNKDFLSTTMEGSSAAAESGEPKFEVGAEQAEKADINFDQNVSLKEESLKDSRTEPSSKEIPCVEASVHTPDPTLVRDVQSVEETATSEEATLSKEEHTKERSFEVIKEEDKSKDRVIEGKVSEEDKDQISRDNTEAPTKDATPEQDTKIIEEPTEAKCITNEKDVAIDEAQGTEEYIVGAANEDIVTAKAVQAEPAQSAPEELQTQTVSSEETKTRDVEITTPIKEEGEVKTSEENFGEKEKEGKTISIPEVKGNEVHSEEIVKTESAEAEFTKNDSGDLPAVQLLVEQAEVLNGKSNEVSDGDLENVVYESATGVSEEVASKSISEADVEKEQVDECPTCSFSEPIRGEPSKSLEENVKDAKELTEENNTTEIINKGDVDELSRKTTQHDAPETIEGREHEAEKVNKEVVEDLELAGASESGPSVTTKNIESIADDSLPKQEEKSLDPIEASKEEEVVSCKEEVLKSTDEDVRAQENVEGNVDEHLTEREIITSSIPESIHEETNKSVPENEKEAHSNEVESTGEITKEVNIHELSPENVQKAAIETSKDCQNETETNKQEVIEELESLGAGETTKDDEMIINALPVEQEEGQLEGGKDIDDKIEILKDIVSKPRVEVQSQVHNKDKEQTIEEVAVSSPELIQGETNMISQDRKFDEGKISEECAREITEEGNKSYVSPETIQDMTEKSEDRGNEVESSSEKVVEELEITGQGYTITSEIKTEAESSADASLVKQEEDKLEEDTHKDPTEVSVERNKAEILEDEAPKEEGVGHNEQSVKLDSEKEEIKEVAFSGTDSTQEETSKSSGDDIKDEESIAEIIKEESVVDFSPVNTQEDAIETPKEYEIAAEKCKEEVIKELEEVGKGDGVPRETPKDIELSLDTSLVKLDEVQQEEVKCLDPIKDSAEESKIEVPKEEALNQRSEDEGFDKEQIQGVSVSTTELVQEETSESPQENVKNVEVVKEGSKPEIINEEAIEKLKDEETEAEKCKEVVQVLETPRAAESSVDTSLEPQEARSLDPVEDSTKENIVEFSTEAAKDVDDNPIKLTEKEIEVLTKVEEDQQPININEAEERVENLVQVPPEEAKIESIGNASNITGVELEGNILTLEETSETEKVEPVDCTTNLEKEIVQELETPKAVESIPRETNKETECSAVASLETQETRSLDQVEDSIQEHIVEKTFSTDAEKDVDDNPVNLTEKEIDVLPKVEEDQQPVNRNEAEEKVENVVPLTPEEAETESSEKARSITGVEVEGNVLTLEETSETEKVETVDHIINLEKEVPKAIETAEKTGSHITSNTGEDVVERSFVASSVKQDDEQEENVGQNPKEGSEEEEKVEDSSFTDVAKEVENKDIGKGIDVSYKGEEDPQLSTKEEESGEKHENKLLVAPKEAETEPGNKSITSITDVEGTTEKVEEFSETEKKEESSEKIDNVDHSVNEVVQQSETEGANESISHDTGKDVESYINAPEKQEKDQYSETTEVLREEKEVEDTPTEVVKDDSKFEAMERTIDIEAKGEKDEEQITKQEGPGEKLEQLPQVISEKTEIEPARESKEVEGTIENLEETSETGKKEEKAETVDILDDSNREVIQVARANESASYETSEDVENNVDPSPEKQEESQHQEPAEEFPENKFDDTLSSEVARADQDNKIETTERALAEAKEEDKDEKQVSQKDEPAEKLEDLDQVVGVDEGVSYETNKDVESYIDPSPEKQKESQYQEPTEVFPEKKVSKTLSSEVVREDPDIKVETTERALEEATEEDKDAKLVSQNDEPGEKLEDLDRVALEETEKEPVGENARNTTRKEAEETTETSEEPLEKEVVQEFKTDEADKNESYDTNKDVEVSTDLSSEKQQEGQSTEPTKVLNEEKNIEDSHSTEKEDGDNKIEATERTIDIAAKGDEKQDTVLVEPTEVLIEEKNVEDSNCAEVTKKDDDNKVVSAERIIDVVAKGEEDEKPATEENESGEQLETLVQVAPKVTETEPTSENSGNGKSEEVKETFPNEETSEMKVIQELKMAEADEGTSYDTNKDVEVYTDPSSKKQEESQSTEPTEVLIEEKNAEASHSAEVVKEDNDNKVEEDEKRVSEQDEPEEQLEILVQVTPKEIKPEPSSENSGNSKSDEVKETFPDEETSETKVTETANDGQEAKEHVSREIDFSMESHHKYTDAETTEGTKESQVITELDEQGTKGSPSSLQEEKIEESSHELEKEDDTISKERDQIEVTDLIEDTKQESLEENAKHKKEDFTATKEAPEEEKLAEEETSLKSDHKVVVHERELASDVDDVQPQSGSVQTEDLSREIGLKEAEPESEVQAKSSDIATEDKSQESDIQVKSGDAPSGTVTEEQAKTDLKEVKLDEEEQAKSLEIVSKEEVLSSSIDKGLQSSSVPTDIAGEETNLKETEPEIEVQVRSLDVAPEEDKGIARTIDVSVPSDSLHSEVVSEETCLKEGKTSDEEQIKSLDICSQYDSASTETLTQEVRSEVHEPESEERVRSYDGADFIPVEEESVNKAEQSSEEHVKSFDIAPEEKDLHKEVKSDSAPTEAVSVETREQEAKQDDYLVKTPDIPPEEKNQPISEETTVQDDSVSSGPVSGETSLKEGEAKTEEQVDSTSAEVSSEEKTVEEVTQNKKEHVNGSDSAFEEKVLERSLDLGSLIEEKNFKEFEPENEEQAIDLTPVVAPEDTILVRNVEIDNQSNVTSDGVSLKNDEPVNKEQVECSEIAERENEASNVNGEVEQKETSSLEEEKEKASGVVPGEHEEKTGQEVAAETLLDSLEDNIKEGSTVPSIEDEKEKKEAREISDESTALAESHDINEKLLVVEPPKEEGVTKHEGDSKLETNNAVKEIASEEVQEQKDQELDVQPEIITRDFIPTQVHESMDESVDSETVKEQVTEGESVTKEFHPIANEDEIVLEDKVPNKIVTEAVKETDSNDHEAEEKAAKKDEESATVVATIEEEKQTDEEVKLVDDTVALPRDRELEDETKREVQTKCESIDTTVVGDKPIVTILEEAQLIEEPVKAFYEPQSIEVEERSFELVPEQPVDQKDPDVESNVAEKSSLDEVAEAKLASDPESIDATSPIPPVATPKIEEIKEDTTMVKEDVITNNQAPDDTTTQEQFQAPSSTLLPEKQEQETAVVETKEAITGEVDYQDSEKREPTHEDSEATNEALPESTYESSQDVSKDEVVTSRDLPIAILEEPIHVSSLTALSPEKPEPETTTTVEKAEEEKPKELEIYDNEKIEDSSATEVANETKLKEEEEDITKAPISVSDRSAEIIEVGAGTEDETSSKLVANDSTPEEKDDGDTTIVEQAIEGDKTEVTIPDDETRDYSATDVTEETCSQMEETKEVKVVEEAGTEIKDVVETVSESDSQRAPVVTEAKTTICETFPEKLSEVPLVEQSGSLLAREQYGGITSTAKGVQEKERPQDVEVLGYEGKESSSENIAEEETSPTKEEPREIKESVSTVEMVGANVLEDVSKASEAVQEDSPKIEVFSRGIPNFEAIREVTDENVATKEKKEAQLLDKDVGLDKEEPTKLEVTEPGIHVDASIRAGSEEPSKVEFDSPSDKGKATETSEADVEAPLEVPGKVASPEPITSIEDVEIIENHLKIATTDLSTRESPSETKFEADKAILKESPYTEDLSREIEKEKDSLNIEEAHITSQETKETETKVTNRDFEAPIKLPGPTEEASPRDRIDRELKGKKEPNPELVSPSNLIQSPKEETATRAETPKGPKESKEAENEKAKTDEEKDGDEEEEEEEDHEESEHPDMPILVQSSRDIDAKAHKKHHGLFSGVGSKVKHSISKVKKAITGKSSNSKTQPSSS